MVGNKRYVTGQLVLRLDIDRTAKRTIDIDRTAKRTIKRRLKYVKRTLIANGTVTKARLQLRYIHTYRVWRRSLIATRSKTRIRTHANARTIRHSTHASTYSLITSTHACEVVPQVPS